MLIKGNALLVRKVSSVEAVNVYEDLGSSLNLNYLNLKVLGYVQHACHGSVPSVFN